MIERIELSQHPEVKAVILTAFPSYRKKSAYIREFYPTQVNSYWNNGSRNEFAIVHLASLQRKPLPTSTHPFFDIQRIGLDNKHNTDLETDHVGNVTLKHLPSGFALVSAGTACGKPATACVLVPAENLTKMLSA